MHKGDDVSGVDSQKVGLEALQGPWVGGGGEVIRIEGQQLQVNGIVVKGGLKLAGDNCQVLGYSVYELVSARYDGCDGGRGDCSASSVTWRAAFAEICWRRPEGAEIQERTDLMNAHMYERAATCGGQAFNVANECEAVDRLTDLIRRWREGGLVRVRTRDICPDWTNRAQTGLSVDHVHNIAVLISAEGFRSRRRGAPGAHEVPVLVRETAASPLGSAALERWRARTSEVSGFPPFLLGGATEFYCSLGSGHFSQALNLFACGAPRLWGRGCYDAGPDEGLREALEEGVESIVLSSDMPTADRRFVSEFLNRTHGRRWHVGEDGHVEIERGEGPAAAPGGQFVALSKVLDAEQLSALVRRNLGVGAGALEGGFGHLEDSSHVAS